MILLLLMMLFLYWNFLIERRPDNFPPGPKRILPFLGDVLTIGTSTRNGYRKLRMRHGDIVGFYLGPQRSVLVSGYDLVKECANARELLDRPRVRTVERFR